MQTMPVCVVTGSSSGLGLATATALLEKGAAVMLSSNQPEPLVAAQTALAKSYGERVACQVCEVSKPGEIQALLDHTLVQFGSLDVWINNAGTSAPSGPVTDVPVTVAENLFATNILGTYYGSIAAMRYFRSKGQGRLINIVGRGEKGPVAGAVLYGSSKSWVRQFTLALAKEEPRFDIGTFNPGLLYTDLTVNPRVLAGQEECMLKGLKFIMPLIGDLPDRAAQRLSSIALAQERFQRENRSRRLLPFALRRLLTGRRASVDVSKIRAHVTAPEEGRISSS